METEQAPRRKGLLRRSFGGFWRLLTWVRVSLSNLLFLAVLLLLFLVITADRLPRVPERGALVIDLSGRVVEQLRVTDPIARLFGGSDQPPPETLLKDVLDAIEHAADDRRIEAIVLATDRLEGAGLTKARDIAEALARFRATGRKVIAIGDAYTQEQYLVAAQADEVWMHPMGFVDLSGYAAYRNYFKDALEKLKIDVHVFRAGHFKSAFESVERSDMSEADRHATGELLRDVWRSFTRVVTERRRLPPEAVDHYANGFDAIIGRHKGDAAAAAFEHGFVDALKTRGEMDAALGEMVGKDREGHFSHVGFRQYVRAVRPSFELESDSGRPAVGVLVASGVILDGEQPPGNVGGDTLAAAIREAAKDEALRALVLRIDSPGGSGFASEVIRESLLEFRESGKPLIASMGSVAASGGYWIAAPADEIWAAATTVTGSIGVLSAFPSFSRALEAMGVNNDGLGTTALAGGLDPSRPLLPQWERILRLVNEHAYRQFLGVVAEGRDMEIAQVAAVAEGRVWTGDQALKIGLVDHIGGLDEAVAAAAKRAGIENYRTRFLEPPADWRTRLLRTLALGPGSLSAWLREAAGLPAWSELPAPLALLAHAPDPRGQYALCLACMPF